MGRVVPYKAHTVYRWRILQGRVGVHSHPPLQETRWVRMSYLTGKCVCSADGEGSESEVVGFLRERVPRWLPVSERASAMIYFTSPCKIHTVCILVWRSSQG